MNKADLVNEVAKVVKTKKEAQAAVDCVFSTITNALKKGDAVPASAVEGNSAIQPIVKPAAEIVMETVTDEMKAFKAYTAMRVARQETKVEGYRYAVEQRKKKE